MCYSPKLPCHAGSDEGIHEEGCEGSSGRKTHLSPPGYNSPVPLPVIRYCNGYYLLRITEGLPPCTIRDESQNEGEQVVCPVRCPGCVVNFYKRLEPDLDPVAHDLKRYHDNRAEKPPGKATGHFQGALHDACFVWMELSQDMPVELGWFNVLGLDESLHERVSAS